RRDRRQSRVVALPERFELSGALHLRLNLISPARRDDVRPDFGDSLVADIEDSNFLGTDEPFVSAGGIRVAIELTKIDVERAPALRPIDVDENVAAVGFLAQLPHRKPQPADVGNVR